MVLHSLLVTLLAKQAMEEEEATELPLLLTHASITHAKRPHQDMEHPLQFAKHPALHTIHHPPMAPLLLSKVFGEVFKSTTTTYKENGKCYSPLTR